MNRHCSFQKFSSASKHHTQNEVFRPQQRPSNRWYTEATHALCLQCPRSVLLAKWLCDWGIKKSNQLLLPKCKLIQDFCGFHNHDRSKTRYVAVQSCTLSITVHVLHSTLQRRRQIRMTVGTALIRSTVAYGLHYALQPTRHPPGRKDQNIPLNSFKLTSLIPNLQVLRY